MEREKKIGREHTKLLTSAASSNSKKMMTSFFCLFVFTFYISILLNMFLTDMYHILNVKKGQNSSAGRNLEDDHNS